MVGPPLSHYNPTAPEGARQRLLKDHLRAVGAEARIFAAPVGGGAIAAVAGLWHDLGKGSQVWQEYVLESQRQDAPRGGRKPIHSTQGGYYAYSRWPGLVGDIVAYMILGHHVGLPDYGAGPGTFLYRLTEPSAPLLLAQALAAEIPDDILSPPPVALPPGRLPTPLWIRMLFSALIDADRLDAERFARDWAAAIRADYPALPAFLPPFNTAMAARFARAQGPVNQVRAAVLAACRAAAAGPPGVYTLEVPTGGGKTLSSLAFALEHAAAHGHQRIIYAIPYTSITDQTADTFRGVFRGQDVVIEHQSHADPSKTSYKASLATENWDGPLIVTTTVQLFESLFGCTPAWCRKLHNIVQSVIVLDEVQLLPSKYLKPLCECLTALVQEYGCTVVLSTATQPDLEVFQRMGRTITGLPPARPIIADPDPYYAALERVRYLWPDLQAPPVAWPDLVAHLQAHPQVLCVVNRARTDAREVCALLGEDAFHLSGLMCAAHRRVVLAEITHRLGAGRPCRVVGTSVIEAGVDLDFPVVYRAFAPLDSLAQTAGRCNRNGLHPRGRGDVHVFQSLSAPYQRHGRDRRLGPDPREVGAGITAAMIRRFRKEGRDVLRRTDFRDYFTRLYQGLNLDEKNISREEHVTTGRVYFRKIADAMRLVDEETVSVCVPYEAGAGLLARLDAEGPSRELLRELQPYMVGIYPSDIQALERVQALREVQGYQVLAPGYYGVTGIAVPGTPGRG